MKEKRSTLLTVFLFTLLFLFMFSFLDFWIISPYFLPEDIAFYEYNEPSWFVKLFFLDAMGRTEPPFSILHIIFLFLISMFSGSFTAFKITDWYSKNRRQKINNAKNVGN